MVSARVGLDWVERSQPWRSLATIPESNCYWSKINGWSAIFQVYILQYLSLRLQNFLVALWLWLKDHIGYNLETTNALKFFLSLYQSCYEMNKYKWSVNVVSTLWLIAFVENSSFRWHIVIMQPSVALTFTYILEANLHTWPQIEGKALKCVVKYFWQTLANLKD